MAMVGAIPQMKIESSDLNVERLFGELYTVPDFQREYVWKPDNVERLLQDIYDELYEGPDRLEEGTEYFIGSVVVCPGPDGYYQLIDGQQRLTTCYLVLCAIRDAVREAGETPSQTLASLISTTRPDAEGNDVFTYRLTLQYEQSDGVLAKVAADDGAPVSEIPRTTESVKHMLNAYSAIREFFRINLDSDVSRIKRFFVAYISRVRLIRIITPNLSHALKVFETINNRGVGLNAMDLLKNLLFIKTSASQYAHLKPKWETLIHTLEACNEKPLRFLRYFVMASYHTESNTPLREDQIYDWLTKHAKQIGMDERPIDFLDLLVECSQAYARFTRAEDPSGHKNRYLENMARFSGNARQHYILLLAGRRLPPEGFSRLCSELENLFFCYTITREPTKSLEYNFARWSHRLREAKSTADADRFIDEHLTKELGQRASDFEYAFLQLDQSRIQQYRMRYILAKLTQYVQEQAFHNSSDTQLSKFLDSAVHVEHILPNTPTDEHRASFDMPDEYDTCKVKLGNLTLLEMTINTAISNGTFPNKREGYAQSNFLLTKSIFDKPNVGVNTQFNKAVAALPQFDEWSSESIVQRQQYMANLARSVWGIPTAEASA
jgi:hypothetical protein